MSHDSRSFLQSCLNHSDSACVIAASILGESVWWLSHGPCLDRTVLCNLDQPHDRRGHCRRRGSRSSGSTNRRAPSASMAPEIVPTHRWRVNLPIQNPAVALPVGSWHSKAQPAKAIVCRRAHQSVQRPSHHHVRPQCRATLGSIRVQHANRPIDPGKRGEGTAPADWNCPR